MNLYIHMRENYIASEGNMQITVKKLIVHTSFLSRDPTPWYCFLCFLYNFLILQGHLKHVRWDKNIFVENHMEYY